MSNILVIDDNANDRDAVSDLLVQAGHEVMLASNGCEGMECLERSLPDLVITDLIMPEKDGIQTIIEIRETNTDLPIVAMTCGGRAINFNNGYRKDLLDSSKYLGADFAVAKPFRSGDFMEIVAQALSDTPQAA